MVYDVKTPEEYLSVLEDDWRKEKLLKIRELILNARPNVKEYIEYKMLGYGLGDKSIFNLNAQSGYVSLYVGTIKKVENGEELLKSFNIGKGCIRVKKSINLAETGLKEFVIKTFEIWESGGETDC